MKPSGEFTIVFEQADGAEAQLVRDRLDMFNIGVTGVSAYYPVHCFLKSERGETMGGLLGGIWGGWLHVTFLWVDEAVRGQDWGTRLMDRAEAYARERGAHSATLDTHSFQARPFYERRGFRVLNDDEVSAGLRAKVVEEEGYGLPAELRVVMRRDL